MRRAVSATMDFICASEGTGDALAERLRALGDADGVADRSPLLASGLEPVDLGPAVVGQPADPGDQRRIVGHHGTAVTERADEAEARVRRAEVALGDPVRKLV